MYVSIWRYVWKIEKFLLTVADIREKKENFFIINLIARYQTTLRMMILFNKFAIE